MRQLKWHIKHLTKNNLFLEIFNWRNEKYVNSGVKPIYNAI